MKYVIRYAVFAMATLSGTAFLSGALRLLRTYYHAQHRFALARVSPSETLLVGIICVASARIYQLMVGSRSDPISKTQTEIELYYVYFMFVWFFLLFMVHNINLPIRGVSSSFLAAFVFATVCAIATGFRMRKKLFAQSTESLPDDLGEALRLWRVAHLISFCCALNPPIYGVVLKIAGSGWLVPGILFGLGLGFLMLWRPRQLTVSDVQPA